jgi:hypothetical protein
MSCSTIPKGFQNTRIENNSHLDCRKRKTLTAELAIY